MSRRALGVLCFGLGVIAAEPLAIACVLFADLMQKRGLR